MFFEELTESYRYNGIVITLGVGSFAVGEAPSASLSFSIGLCGPVPTTGGSE